MEIEDPAATATIEVQAPDLLVRKRQQKPDRSIEAVQAAQARADQTHIERMRNAVKKANVQKAKPAVAAPAVPKARPRSNAPVKHQKVSVILTCSR